ncbi:MULTISPECIES: response regulator [Pedobacter]|uniref:response regulator n=1 Tax=Pedobacter TaxID=84567 RepID=UPI0021092F58|nr:MULTISPECIES: response regulator [unclassified Pedobacter]
MNYKKVLIVDDAQIDRYLAQKVMKKYDFASDVISVESAMDALSYIDAYKNDPGALPELIFLDINMPEMNGFDFLDAYKEFPDSIKRKCIIVMLSSSLHPEDKQRALDSPYVYRFLSKPINPDKLQELREIAK